MRSYSVYLILAAAGLAACGGGESTAPPKPASITISPPATINGTVNGLVQPSPTFTVLDDKGAALGNIAVSVTVSAGGGTLTSPATKSNNGATSVGTWILGPNPGLNTLTVAVAGLAPVTITADAHSAFFVDLRYAGVAIDPSFKTAFAAAKARIESIITADLQDAQVTNLDVAGCPGAVSGMPALTEIIDDLIVYAVVDSIDGPGKILGSSGPCYTRTAGGLSLIGFMHFDVADFQGLKNDGRLNDVVLHEMLHVVGFGTLWVSKGQVTGNGTNSPLFIGAQAVAGCIFHGGTAANQCGGNSVPLETTGGQGTRDVHWRETTSATGIGFRTELMTGFVSAVGIANPLSRISIGSLGDMGYTVNVTLNDPYTVPSTAAVSLGLIRDAQGIDTSFQLNDLVLEPIGSVDATGRVTPIKKKP